ncbi:helix-turn-helix domain-containing protein [Nocardioides astragali]|uniref:Helix-turn-helix domain-containing protein n=1 Tax=Nocardioides astragali TaxID=1776736 RepID=A0ABW2N0M1_9ACTN|nr:helix-turn-helix transcriptional regulator [Nocardioides astragali]
MTPTAAPSEHLLHFGAAVRRHREEAGMSQEQLGHRAGLHRTYIGGVERGERNVGLLNVFAIADALDVPAGELLHVTPRSP